MATLGELRGMLRLLLNDSAAEGYLWSNRTLDLQINFAVREYSRHFPRQRETAVVTVTGQQQYDLPADCLSVLQVAAGDAETRGHGETGLGWWVSGDAEGLPVVGMPGTTYQTYAGRLILSPAPAMSGQALALRYLACHAIISADGDSSTVPEGDEDLLLAMAAAGAIEGLWADEAKRRRFEGRTGEPITASANLFRQQCERGRSARAARVRSWRLLSLRQGP